MVALDMVCIQRVLVLGVADNNKGKTALQKGSLSLFLSVYREGGKKKKCHTAEGRLDGSLIK